MTGKLIAALAVLLSVGCAAGRPAPQRVSADPNWTVVRDVKLVSAERDADCGAAALEMVLTHWQPRTDGPQLRASMGVPESEKGFQAGMLRDVARRHGLQAFLVEGSADDLKHEIGLGRPVIVGVVIKRLGRSRTHYQVVTGVNKATGEVLVADPRGSWRQVDTATMTAEWEPTRRLALVVFP